MIAVAAYPNGKSKIEGCHGRSGSAVRAAVGMRYVVCFFS
jgi:hypothetical protein